MTNSISVPSVHELYVDLASRVEYTANGDLLWAKTKRSDLVGTVAGRIDYLGYRIIEGLGGKAVLANRLIFFMHTGAIPQVIDHINGDSSDNRIENLRPATVSKNAMNCKLSASNTSGVKGVGWHKATAKWTAYIRIDKRHRSLGVFESFFDAVCSRRAAELAHYGEFSR